MEGQVEVRKCDELKVDVKIQENGKGGKSGHEERKE